MAATVVIVTFERDQLHPVGKPEGSRLWMSFASLRRESHCSTPTLALRPQCPQQELVSCLSEDFAGLWTLEGDDALEKTTE